MLGFFVGLVVGIAIGVFAMGLLTQAKIADLAAQVERYQRQRNHWRKILKKAVGEKEANHDA